MVTGPLLEMLARNKTFASKYQAPPSLMKMVNAMRSSGQGVVVVSCSDPRVYPDQILGLDSTLKATMIRNAGGRALDAIRTILALQTIGAPGTIVVMHHTDCGMTHFSDSKIQNALLEIAPSDEKKIRAQKFGEITGSIEDSVREDVALLKASPWITDNTQIVGLKYDIDTGELSEVSEVKSEL